MNCSLSAAAWLLLVGAAAAQVPTPRFQSGVELVEVTMVVRDRAGRPVTDLRPEEITIRDKGVVQRIVAFSRISIPVVPAPAAPPPLEARDVSTNERIGEARVFMLVLDALHVAAVNVRSARQHARDFIERHVGPNDIAGVFSPGGLPGATEDFTTDKARLIAAIEQFNATKLPSSTAARAREMRVGTAAHGGKDPDAYERADRAQVLAGVLQALATNAERIGARRKTLLLFSEGTDFDINLPGDVMRAMDAAVKSLARADVSVYAINPRGPRVAGDEQIETPIYNELPVPGTLSADGLEEEYRNSLVSLRYLAELTGGFSVADRTEMGPAFDRVLRDSSDYYVLAYEPLDRPRPGEFRRIEVRTSRPETTVIARKGYSVRVTAPARGSSRNPFAEPAPSTLGRPAGRSNPVADALPPTSPSPASAAPDDELKQLLANPLPKAGLPLRLQAIPFKGDRDKAVVRLVVEILGGELQFVERRGRSEERIELALLTVDGKGRQSNGRSTTIDLSLAPDELQRVKTSGVRWLSKLDLPPGRHQVRIAARAARTGATGLITQTLEVPKYDSSQPSMSGVTMTSLPAIVMPTRGTPWKTEAVQTPPTAARLFVVGDQVTAVVDVYPGPTQGVEASIFGELSSAGSKPVRVPSYVRTGSDPATREAVFQIDTRKLPPGEYILRVVCVRRGGDGVERRVPFEVVRSR